MGEGDGGGKSEVRECLRTVFNVSLVYKCQDRNILGTDRKKKRHDGLSLHSSVY